MFKQIRRLFQIPGNTAIRLKGLTWTTRDFARGVLITGDIGSGKTLSGLNTLLFELFRNQQRWGGLVMDEKGVFWETLVQMADHFGRKEDVIVLEVRPDSAFANWQPRNRFNLVGDRSVPWSAYGKMVIEAALALGQDNDQSFFREQAELHIAAALETLALLGYEVTLENACNLLTVEADLKTAVAALQLLNLPAAQRLAAHFADQLINTPLEQRSGVLGTILNYLRHFCDPAIAEVFCRSGNFQLADLDHGKILCLVTPQKYQSERRYVNMFLKSLFYLHVLRRYNKPAAERAKVNLLALWVDEAQRFVSASKNGFGEHSILDIVREANAAVIFATQSTTSFIPPLGRDVAKVVTLNLRNRIIFKSADQEDAELSAQFIGRKRVRKVSWNFGRQGGQRNVSEEEDYVITPHLLRQLRPHHAVIVHCRLGHRRRLLLPLKPDGKTAAWFWRH